MPRLHSGQTRIYDHPARFKVAACGRRWGKSYFGIRLSLEVALRGGKAWWIGPSYRQTNLPWKKVQQMARKVPGADISKSDRTITFPNNGEVSIRSGSDPDSLRGEGLNLVVLDECPLMREEVWTEALRPALSDKRGRALFIGSPKGREWFYRLWQRGQDEEQGAWSSWKIPTQQNPYIDPGEIEDARYELSERVFRQEFLADFLDEGAGVFRYVFEAATAEEQDQGRPGAAYVIGVDWGKTDDYTVFAVVDIENRAVVHVDRSNRVDYALQRQRLAALWERFGRCQIIAEANAMGEPNIENLHRDGLRVKAWVARNDTKAAVIDGLALAFEKREISIIPHPVLMSELDAYQTEKLPSGLYRYSAPSGMHDDTVIALALAWESAFGGPRWRPEGVAA